MKSKLSYIVALLAGLFSLASCIDQGESVDAIFQRDVEAIENYIATTPMVNVKEYRDSLSEIRVIWQQVSESGIKVNAERNDTVRVDYVGKLLNETIFDTSIEALAKENNIYDSRRDYEPIEFPINDPMIIFGFRYGISFMEEGDRATIIMPSVYGYGAGGQARIPANSPIIFEISLVKVIEGEVKE